MPKLIDITDSRFGRLTVLDVARKEQRPGGSRVFWRCLCDCGQETVVLGEHLRSGKTQSCGCFGKEARRQANTTHGQATKKARTRLYSSWSNMLQRCTNPDHPKWDYYGGCGVTVCESWFDFETFATDMGERPPGKTIDRIDPNGHYEPGNCRWATALEQRHNWRPKV